MDDEKKQPNRNMIPVQYPGNDREYIIDQLFWGEDDSHWDKLPGPGCEDVTAARGYARTYTWRAREAGAFLTWRGRIEADLVGIERLRVRAQVAVADSVAVRAEIDGSWITICEAKRGNDDYDEYEGRAGGRRLTGIEVVFTAANPGPVVSSIMWVMVVKPGLPAPVAIPDPAWPGLLCEKPSFEAVPLLEVFFDMFELKEMRDQLHSPEYAEFWAEQVRDAESFARIDPECTANQVIPYNRNRYGRPDAPEQSPAPEVAAMAFVGVVEGRDDLRIMAARWALTWSRCERWVQYGIENLRGIPMSHGRFAQAFVTTVVSQVLDWCGSLLTESGQRELARAIHDLGILDIDGIMHPDSYVWHMNQGIVYECGRLYGIIAVRNWYPAEFDRRLDDAKRMLQTCLTTSFHDDGAGTEGSAYWNYTMSMAVPLIVAVAKSTDRTVAEITPPNVVESGRWALINRRTDTIELKFLPHADSRYDRVASPLVAAFFAGPLRQIEWANEVLSGDSAPDEQASIAIADPFLYHHLRYLREIQTVDKHSIPDPPTLTVFPRAGQVDVRPAAGEAGMRIYFLGGPRTGHCHDDKNSFILEAFGRTLLLDRGTPSYTHPAAEICKMTEAHNAVAPDGLSQSVPPGQGGAVLSRAEAVERNRVIIESDAAECWPGLGVRVMRRVELRRPATLIVEDEVEWSRKVSTWQCWQAPSQWLRHEDGWIISVDGVEMVLIVSPDDDFEIEAGPFSVDGLLRPIHRLVVRTPRQKRSRVRTILRARRAGDEWPSI